MTHSFASPRRARFGRAPWAAAIALSTLAGASTAHADNTAATTTTASTDKQPGPSGEPQEDTSGVLGEGPSLTLDPTAPQAGALPGGMTPAFGQASLNNQDWRFDFHGYLTAPLNAGINQRQSFQGGVSGARPGQSSTVLHAPPVVPDDLETFSHTGVVPTTYAQLNFSEGNGVVSAHVTILARQANVSESFLEPASQAGITDVFLSYLPDLGSRVKLRILVGAFTTRYGSTGEYDEGRYGTPLIAQINGAGEVVGARIGLGKQFTLHLEQGLQGQTNTANASITPDVWNNFANPEEGATFVNHFHAGVGYRGIVTVGGHFINAQSHDDRATGTLAADGSVSILAADANFAMRRFGHLYFAYSNVQATHARVVSRILTVLNTPGGPGLENDYLGPESAGGDGTGTLSTFGGQYDLSLGRLVSWPAPFAGNGPDVFLSVFGMLTHVSSRVAPTGGMYGDGITKAKAGVEATYSIFPWLAVSARFDEVVPNTDDSRYSFAVVSPRVIFRSNWLATDQLSLQYSHWFDGSRTTVRSGSPPIDDLSITPDSDMISLAASMWW
jgi:hypothetical protein